MFVSVILRVPERGAADEIIRAAQDDVPVPCRLRRAVQRLLERRVQVDVVDARLDARDQAFMAWRTRARRRAHEPASGNMSRTQAV